ATRDGRRAATWSIGVAPRSSQYAPRRSRSSSSFGLASRYIALPRATGLLSSRFHRRASDVASWPAMPAPTRTARAPAGTPTGSTPPLPRRSTTMRIVVVAVAVGLLVGSALIFFARGDGGSRPAKKTKKSVSAEVKLTLGGVSNANAGTPATLGN